MRSMPVIYLNRLWKVRKEHAHWLETQLELMDKVGDDLYLAEQIVTNA